jgi:hypothetical protein
VFERLWEETGCRAVVSELAGKRKHGFALERAVLLTGHAPILNNAEGAVLLAVLLPNVRALT